MSDKRKNQKIDVLTLPDPAKEKKYHIFLFALLLIFGIYQSIIYWGHQPVPHFDFNCFQVTSRPLLHFQPPIDYKRTPLVGILHIWLGSITGGDYPTLQGGWLLNSISHTLTIIFLWLTARKLIGPNAVWFAVIAIINPFGLQLLTEAIAETPMLFFIWITFYFIFIRSPWAYLFASLATMVRYECAALIAGMFILDMIEGNKKQRIKAFVYASAASIPLALWMLGTFLHRDNLGATHYLNIFKKDYTSQFVEGVQNRTGFLKHAEILWQVGFYPLFQPAPSSAGQDFANAIMNTSKVLVALTFIFGSIYGLFKKQWKILVLLIFLLPYFWIHSKYPYPIHRYHATIFAIVMLICIYGIINFWQLIKTRIPKFAILAIQTLALIVILIWAMTLWGYLPQISEMSKASVSLPYISVSISFLIFAAGLYVYRKNIFNRIIVLSLMILMIVSNQFLVAGVVGNGERDIEFKYLTQWYSENAKPDEKLVSTVPIILTILAPKYKDNFIHTDTFDANSPEEFVMECYKKNITYVAWDSREGLMPNDHYYKYWKMSNIAPLAAGRDIGPYQFIRQFRVNQRRYINLYRLKPIQQVMRKNEP
ncbi:MAG: hypothetical protein ABFD79_04145 [Phycisphaerales bacterium]